MGSGAVPRKHSGMLYRLQQLVSSNRGRSVGLLTPTYDDPYRYAPPSLISHISIRLGGELTPPRLERVPREGPLVELDPQSGKFGNLKIAVLQRKRFENEISGRPFAV